MAELAATYRVVGVTSHFAAMPGSMNAAGTREVFVHVAISRLLVLIRLRKPATAAISLLIPHALSINHIVSSIISRQKSRS